MRLLRSAALCAAALTLTAPMIAVAKDATEIKVQGSKEAAKGTSQVVVGAFNVGFIFESLDQTATTGGLIGAFGGTTKAKSTLIGVTPEMMQAIADRAYADFTTQLAAKGFTVLEPSALFGHATMAKAKGQKAPLDINLALEKGSKGKATYYKPTALPVLVMIPGDFVGSGMSSMGIAMAAGQSAYAMSTYAKAAGVSVVDVVYLIDFSNTKRPGSFSFGGLQVNSGLSVTSGFSRLSVISPTGKQGSLMINQPVAVEGEFVEKSDASSGFDKTSQAVGNVAAGIAAGFGLGGIGLGKTRKFEFTAKPGNYEAGATKAASLASERLIAQLAAMR